MYNNGFSESRLPRAFGPSKGIPAQKASDGSGGGGRAVLNFDC